VKKPGQWREPFYGSCLFPGRQWQRMRFPKLNFSTESFIGFARGNPDASRATRRLKPWHTQFAGNRVSNRLPGLPQGCRVVILPGGRLGKVTGSDWQTATR
jgi:hypothetical protein